MATKKKAQKGKSKGKGKSVAKPPPEDRSKVKVRLSKDEQSYIIKGKHYPRMTNVISVLDPAFQQLKIRMADKMAEYAAYGNLVHRITELNDKNQHKAVDEMLNNHPELAIVLGAWCNWVESAVERFVAIEQKVWSDEFGCAGTVDRVAILKGDRGRPSIADIKTSSSLTDSAFIQMAGYKRSYNEGVSGRDKVQRTIVVWMPRPSPGDLSIKERTGKKWDEKFLRAVKEYGQLVGQGPE